MKERPIIFSAPMVRALLAGTKTQTRRLAKSEVAPYGVAGDRLWVKEAFATVNVEGSAFAGAIADAPRFLYRADEPEARVRFRSPLHMPRRACRLVLAVTEVRSELLQEISESDAVEEGVASAAAYAKQWDVLNGAHAPWSTNPRVWVVTFTRGHDHG